MDLKKAIAASERLPMSVASRIVLVSQNGQPLRGAGKDDTSLALAGVTSDTLEAVCVHHEYV